MSDDTIAGAYSSASFRAYRGDVAPQRAPASSPPGPGPRAGVPLTPIDLPTFFNALAGPPRQQEPSFILGLIDCRLLRRSAIEAVLSDLEQANRSWRGREPHPNIAPSIAAIREHLG